MAKKACGCRNRAAVGAIGTPSVEFMAGIAAGAAAGGTVDGVLESLPVLKEKDLLRHTAKGGLGYVMLTQQENDFIQGAGAAMLGQAVGGIIGDGLKGIFSSNDTDSPEKGKLPQPRITTQAARIQPRATVSLV